MYIGPGKLELLDSELKLLEKSGCFLWPGSGYYVFDDTAAKELLKKKGITLTKAQREIWVYWNLVFSGDIYSSKSEIARRISLCISGDRENSGNIGHMMRAIERKIKKEESK